MEQKRLHIPKDRELIDVLVIKDQVWWFAGPISETRRGP